nr:immunoglobulin heavy chain junction region [Mus musculus]
YYCARGLWLLPFD